MCMHSVLIGGEQQATFLLKAQEMGLTQGQYVFVPYDTLLYSVPYANASYFPLRNNSRLRRAYDAVLTITVASEPLSFNQALTMAKTTGELTLAVQPEQVNCSHVSRCHFNTDLSLLGINTVRFYCEINSINVPLCCSGNTFNIMFSPF